MDDRIPLEYKTSVNFSTLSTVNHLVYIPALQVQFLSRGTFHNILKIKYIKESVLLCPFSLTGAKQGQLSYITDNVTLTRNTPARVLYAIRKKHHRNTGVYMTTHQSRPLSCKTMITKPLQNSMPFKRHTVLQHFSTQQFTEGG